MKSGCSSKVADVYIRDRRLAEQAKAFDALGVRLATLVAASKTDEGKPRRGGRTIERRTKTAALRKRASP